MPEDDDDFDATVMPRAPSAEELAAEPEGRRIQAELKARLFGRPKDVVRIGRYPVDRKLGQGGMGTVYAATDPDDGRPVAIKVVRSDDGRAMRRLRREAKAMLKLEHPNIVAVHEVGEGPEGLFMVMDLVEGQTLGAWVEPGRPWSQIVALGIEAAEALGVAHGVGVVHRDVKPDNILVDLEGRAQLLDFGIAKPLPGSEDLSTFTEQLTRSGVTPGTLAYMAPEQLLGLPIGPAVDQFGLCVTLFEALHGAKPFEGHTIDAVALAIVQGDIISVPDVDRVPERVAQVVERGLAVEPEHRFDSMDALIQSLRAAAEHANSPSSSGEGG